MLCLIFLQINTIFEMTEISRLSPEEVPVFVPEEEEEEETIPEIPAKGIAFLPENYQRALSS